MRCDSSGRSWDEASGPAPPEPAGQPGVAAHGFVEPPSKWLALVRSALRALGSQALAARPRATFTTGCYRMVNIPPITSLWYRFCNSPDNRSFNSSG
jgi:hypothetical protein